MTDETPRSELHRKLQALWHEAGCPSMRRISEMSGVSHPSVHSTLTGRTFPTWRTGQAIIGSLGGEPKEYEALWQKAYIDEMPATRDPRNPLPQRQRDIAEIVEKLADIAAAIRELKSE